MASTSVGLAHVLAHEGGWDEMLLVAGPIFVIIALLALVKRRVDHAAKAVSDATSTHDEPGPIRDGAGQSPFER
jgi:hypothetical protein